MPIDASIPLQVRLPQFEDPDNALLKYEQLKNVRATNAMAEYQMGKHREEDDAARAMDSAWRKAQRPDGTIDRAEVMRSAPGRAVPKLMEAFSKMDAEKLKQLKDSLSISGGALATISQQPTVANAQRVVSELVRVGLPGADKMFASIPQSDAEVGPWVRLHAGTTEHTLKVLEAFQPKIERSVEGSTVTYRNTSPLGGAIGAPMSPAIPMTMTPDARATDARARERMAFDQQQSGKPTVITGPNGEVFSVDPRAATGRVVTGEDGQPLNKGEKPLTESQSNATAYGMRAQDSNDILKQIATKNNLSDLSVLAAKSRVGNIAVPEWAQQAQAAKLNFITAVLRKESGAAIPPSEFDAEDRKYFPQVGDGPNTIKQKERARELAVEALGVQAGPGAKNIKGKPAKPRLGEVQDGYLFKGGDPANPSSWEKVKR